MIQSQNNAITRKLRQWNRRRIKWPCLYTIFGIILVYIVSVRIWKQEGALNGYVHMYMGAPSSKLLKPTIDHNTMKSSSKSLKTVIDHNTMGALQGYMRQEQARILASMPEQKLIEREQKWRENSGVQFFYFLKTQAPTMFPLLGNVSITADASRLSFNGQEFEDREIYRRFLNEKTRMCHNFGNGGLFESGAYKGVEWSNTFFFEKHFSFPSILVEASKNNWKELDDAVSKHRPLADVHHAALCPIGEPFVCLEDSTEVHNAENKVKLDDTCKELIPCYNFDESRHYSFVSLDIETFEWDFLKFRNLQADLILIEVIYWLYRPEVLMTLVEIISRLADLGYFLYDKMIFGVRNFLFISKDLVEDCFLENVL